MGQSPDLLIVIHYFVAVAYAVAAINLVYASVLGYRHLTLGRRMKEPSVAGRPTSSVIGITLGVLWVGAAIALGGAGAHHVRHAAKLAEVRCEHGWCDLGAHLSLGAQALGSMVAISAAVFLISILGERKPPVNE